MKVSGLEQNHGKFASGVALGINCNGSNDQDRDQPEGNI